MSELFDTPVDAFALNELEPLGQAEQDETTAVDERQIVPLTPEQATLVAEHFDVVDYVLHEAVSQGKLGPHAHLSDDFAGYLQLELCRTATRYNATVGASFKTYATNRLRYEIIDIIRNLSSLDGRPRSAVQRYLQQARQAEVNGQSLEPEAKLVVNVSLDDPLDSGDEAGLTRLSTLPDPLPTPEEVLVSDSSVDHITQLVHDLPTKLRTVVEEYIAGTTLDEIGERRNVTESRACQLMTQAKQLLLGRLDIAETEYDDKTLADKVLGNLLHSKHGTFSARSGADVTRRISNQTGVGAERVAKVIKRLQAEGYLEVDYSPRTRYIIDKLRLTPLGARLEVMPEPAVNADIKDSVVPDQRLEQEELTADSVLASLSRQLSISSPT